MVLFTKPSEKKLFELYEARKDVIEAIGKSTDVNENRTKAWTAITDALNSELGDGKLTIEQVKKKWKNLKIAAKLKDVKMDEETWELIEEEAAGKPAQMEEESLLYNEPPDEYSTKNRKLTLRSINKSQKKLHNKLSAYETMLTRTKGLLEKINENQSVVINELAGQKELHHKIFSSYESKTASLLHKICKNQTIIINQLSQRADQQKELHDKSESRLNMTERWVKKTGQQAKEENLPQMPTAPELIFVPKKRIKKWRKY